jgi:hypothetical protein
MKFDMRIFENMSRKFNFFKNVTRITSSIHEDLCTSVVISRIIHLSMIYVPDRSCGVSQNTRLVFVKFLMKILPVIEICGKIWYCRTGHR